ncbi:MAG: hypothetical protein JW816_03855 [Candidatus Buchananbacteria bacterium]|nr:hypothetical protein [Candidatus Buchananbacteria bacterium]
MKIRALVLVEKRFWKRTEGLFFEVAVKDRLERLSYNFRQALADQLGRKMFSDCEELPEDEEMGVAAEAVFQELVEFLVGQDPSGDYRELGNKG